MPNASQPLIAAIILVASIAYAMVRYIGFGGVPLSEAPLFIANKGISLAALALLVLSRTVGDGLQRRAWGHQGLALAGLHVVVSGILLTPAYFPKFFAEDQRLSASAATAMLLGAIALILLAWLFVASQTQPPTTQPARRSLRRFAGRGVLLLTAGHVALMGWGNWFVPSAWPGGLPPITLIAFLLAVVGLLWPVPRTR